MPSTYLLPSKVNAKLQFLFPQISIPRSFPVFESSHLPNSRLEKAFFQQFFIILAFWIWSLSLILQTWKGVIFNYGTQLFFFFCLNFEFFRLHSIVASHYNSSSKRLYNFAFWTSGFPWFPILITDNLFLWVWFSSGNL